MLDRGLVGVPVHEDQLADVHVVLICELEVEHTVSEILLRQRLHEVLPALVPGSDLLNHLNQRTSTIFSALMTYMMYLVSAFRNFMFSNSVRHCS